jgi:hypothetical protein
VARILSESTYSSSQMSSCEQLLKFSAIGFHFFTNVFLIHVVRIKQMLDLTCKTLRDKHFHGMFVVFVDELCDSIAKGILW